jgi:hypothetical protein
MDVIKCHSTGFSLKNSKILHKKIQNVLAVVGYPNIEMELHASNANSTQSKRKWCSLCDYLSDRKVSNSCYSTIPAKNFPNFCRWFPVGSCWKHRKLAGTYSNKSGKCSTEILLPRFSDFRCFSASFRLVPAVSVLRNHWSGKRHWCCARINRYFSWYKTY